MNEFDKQDKNCPWWQRAIIYQIYPRSFMDRNDDGVGDLQGIISKLDYLTWLGINAVWLSPIYPSPMADFGYDISDYTEIHNEFGTMRDFDLLLEEAHRRNLKIILDLVPNHTSDQHPWFLQACSARDNPKRDWYIWSDPAPDGGPPNNWLSVFGGSAWEFEAVTGQYYYHAFLKQQPDLNWRNPEVQAAMFEVLHFWLEKGIDGFRVDVMWHMVKDLHLRDNPPNPHYKAGEESPYNQLLPAYSTDQPEVHELVAMLRTVLDRYDHKVMIGEVYLPVNRLVTYYGEQNVGAHMPFNFQLLALPWNAKAIFAAINEYEASLPPGAWPNWVLGNHDWPRIASRIGLEQTKIAALLLLTLRGTPTLYYGDELGMCNVAIAQEQMLDPHGKQNPALNLSRDPVRTPMQWDNSPNAGFSRVKSWLPVAHDYHDINVINQQEKEDSLLNFYRRLLHLRHQEAALQIGDYIPVGVTNESVAYIRYFGSKRFLIAVNLSHMPEILDCKELAINGEIIFATHKHREQQKITRHVELDNSEGIIAALNN